MSKARDKHHKTLEAMASASASERHLMPNPAFGKGRQAPGATGAGRASGAAPSSDGAASTASTSDGGGGARRASDHDLDQVDSLFADRAKAGWTANPMRATLSRHMSKGDVMSETLAMPVRDGVQTLYRITRDKAVAESSLFCVWFLMFVFMVVQVYDTHDAFMSDDALIDLLLDEEFEGASFKKNLHDVRRPDEMWTWLEGPMYNGMYPNEWYNGDAYDAAEQGYVLNYYRLVGGVQLRQLRVRNDSCTIRRFLSETAVHDGVELGRFDTRDGTCFAEFESDTEARDAFVGFTGNTSYEWTDGHHSLDGLFGFGPSYGTGGYVVELSLDRDVAWRQLSELKADRWTDRHTRAVVAMFNLYNTQTKLLTVVRVLFEYFDSGLLMPSFKFYTMKLVVHQSKMDQLRVFVEIAYLVLLIYYAQREFKHAYYTKRKLLYLSRFKNMFEVLVILVNLVAAYSWIKFTNDSVRNSFDVNSETFVDMYELAESFILCFTWAAALGLVYALKTFKFLSVSRKMSTLWMTLARAMDDLVTFFLAFLLIVAGFAVMANFFFGHLLRKYHNLSASFSTLLRFPLGDFDYKSLQRARPALASAFFTMYNVMVFLVIMNMFIGIITKYFDEVHEDLKRRDAWKRSMLSWEGERALWVRRTWAMKTAGCCWRKRSEVEESDDQYRLEREEEVERRRRKFMQLMHKCMRGAKYENNIDLYVYFEQLFQDAEGFNLYVRVNELCALVQRDKCAHQTCVARLAIDTFHKMKVSMLVGKTRGHKPITGAVIGRRKGYEVIKLTDSGTGQRRVLCLHQPRGLLLNFDKDHRLRKKLPLKQLLQIERSTVDPSRLTLMFTAKGMTPDQEKRCGVGSMETSYELVFTWGPQWREDFVADLLRCLETLPETNDTDEEEDDDVESAQRQGGTLRQMIARRQSVSSKPAAGGSALTSAVMALQKKAVAAKAAAGGGGPKSPTRAGAGAGTGGPDSAAGPAAPATPASKPEAPATAAGAKPGAGDGGAVDAGGSGRAVGAESSGGSPMTRLKKAMLAAGADMARGSDSPPGKRGPRKSLRARLSFASGTMGSSIRNLRSKHALEVKLEEIRGELAELDKDDFSETYVMRMRASLDQAQHRLSLILASRRKLEPDL